jgi:chemotaxis response regulator CheB
MSPIRVVVVEDFLPFRQYVCMTLAKLPEVQVICEASDGLEAVEAAGELKPDLILLDIGPRRATSTQRNSLRQSVRGNKSCPSKTQTIFTQGDSAGRVLLLYRAATA